MKDILRILMLLLIICLGILIQSEEDKKLKENIDLWALRIQDESQEIALIALTQLRDEVRSTTTSMTSVPKPFKFLKIYYEPLVKHYEGLAASDFKVFCSL